MGLETLDFFLEHLGTELPGISVLDVGASGGTFKRWDLLGDHFSGIGVDPLINEVNRLNSVNQHAHFSYLAGRVTWREWEKQFPLSERGRSAAHTWKRCSADAACKNSGLFWAQEINNHGAPIEYSSDDFEIDELVQRMPEKRIDFIKSDTDGHEIAVLKGADQTLASDQVLGVMVECYFAGDNHPLANHFANIDTYMRGKGFALLDLTINRYSRSALPSRFISRLPGPTETGQPQWGDAYYFRDFCDPDFETIAGWRPNKDHIIRQCLLLELARQTDSLVELLLAYAEPLGIKAYLSTLLDRLVRRYGDPGLGDSYDDIIRRFEAGDRAFFTE